MQRIQIVTNFARKHYKMTGFVIVFLLLYINILAQKTFAIYDSGGYDIMSEVFAKQGLFNFKPYIQDGSDENLLFSLRGYAWPWIIALCKKTRGYKVFYSLFLASGLGYAIPEFFEKISDKEVNWYARILPTVLTMCFWNGLIIYPLSDIPAVVMVSFGLLFLIKITEHNNKLKNCCLAMLCGLFLGISYYIRSGCKPIIFIAIIVILLYKYKRFYLKKLAIVSIFCLGVGISMIPQTLINISCNNTFSYEVPIFFTTRVEDLEYYNGFKQLRYETNISGRHPEIAMISYDNVIDNLLAVEDVAVEDVTMATVISLIWKYPLEMLGLYATKFANLIDPRYGNQLYITDLSSRQYIIEIFNFLIWFLTFLSLGLKLSEKNWKETATHFFNSYFFYVLSFVFPGLVHLLGTHTEARYFYPCYVISYAYLATLCDWKKTGWYIKKHLFNVIIMGIVLFACLNAIWNFTFENFKYSQLLLEPKAKQVEVRESDLIRENDFVMNYGIWTFEYTDSNYLNMTGYIIAQDKTSQDSKLSLLLLSDNVEYEYDINLSNNIYESEPYNNSKFSISKQLIELEEGIYQVGLRIENNSEMGIVWTGNTVEVKTIN